MKKRVALIGDNSIEYIKHLLSIWNEGDCAVLIDWRIPFGKALQMMESVNVQNCFIERSFFENSSKNNNVKFHVFDVRDKEVKLIPKYVVDMYKKNVSCDEAVILFSSGTTGKAKGVVLSHYAITTNAEAIQQYMKLNASTNIQIVKSLSHSATLVGELLVSLKARCNIFISTTLILPNRLMHHLISSKIHIMCVNPTLLQLYCKIVEENHLQITELEYIYVSGSILDAMLLKKAKCVFPNTKIMNVYGLTEAGPRVASQIIGFNSYSERSVGKAIEGVQIKIEKDNQDAPIFTKGEVLVKTPSKYLYLLKNGVKVVSKDPWIHTGDIGFLDQYGNLFIAGRTDSMIFSSSHNVYPEEVEQQINSYLGIEDSLVFEQRGRIVCHYTGINIRTHDIRKFLKDKLATYEIPADFVHVEQLPKNSNGKKIRKKA